MNQMCDFKNTQLMISSIEVDVDFEDFRLIIRPSTQQYDSKALS